MENNYLSNVIKQFLYYKSLGEKAIYRIPDDKINWQFNDESNSLAIIVKHLSGNMLSRWTDFLLTDGEKEWRNRDTEFESDSLTKKQVLEIWDKGWDCFLKALSELTIEDLEKTIHIRNEAHSVLQAINRQLAHYPYHIGQIIFIAKMTSSKWESLSIPKTKSKGFS